jgi:hypothetical protein
VNLIKASDYNLQPYYSEFTKVEPALKALKKKTIDRLLFPHYLDLLFLMSDPDDSLPLSDIYIVKELDKSYQIGMVLSHGDGSSVRNQDFYTCLEIMTSRISSEVRRLDEYTSRFFGHFTRLNHGL